MKTKKLKSVVKNDLGINYLAHSPLRCPSCKCSIPHVINKTYKKILYSECPECGELFKSIKSFIDHTKPTQYGIGHDLNDSVPPTNLEI